MSQRFNLEKQAARLSREIENYTANVNSMSPLEKKRAEDKIEKMMRATQKTVAMQQATKLWACPDTGAMVVSIRRPERTPRAFECTGQILRARDYPALYKRIGHTYTKGRYEYIRGLRALWHSLVGKFQLP